MFASQHDAARAREARGEITHTQVQVVFHHRFYHPAPYYCTEKGGLWYLGVSVPRQRFLRAQVNEGRCFANGLVNLTRIHDVITAVLVGSVHAEVKIVGSL